MAGLQLQLPRNSLPVTRDNPAVQMALSDPRSNTVVPTARERADIATGSYECVYVERLPDGSLYRGPGLFDLEPNPDAMYRPSGVVGVKGMAWGRNQRCRRK